MAQRETATDTRKVRRVLTPNEAGRLLAAAKPRRLFYATQLLAGLRIGEIGQLQWRDLHLEHPTPYVKLRVETTKARRADTVDLSSHVVGELSRIKPPFAGPTDRVFKSTPTLKTFKKDLKRAGISREDGQGRTLDRHALRTTFVSWLGSAGVDPRTAQELARHADIS